MSAFDWANVLDIAPELGMPPTTESMQAAIIGIVTREVTDEGWGDDAITGRMYLAAHLATLSLRRGNGQITGEAVGALKRQYATLKSINPSLALTSYGVEFERQTRLQPTVLGAVY